MTLTMRFVCQVIVVVTALSFTTSEAAEQIKVAVIGGGVSGLSAARALLDSKDVLANVTVYEAKDRLGGRVFTDYTFGSGADADLGASWIHGTTKYNPVYNLMVLQNGVKFQNSNFDKQATWLDKTGDASAAGERLPDSWVADGYEQYEALLEEQEDAQDSLKQDISLDQHFLNIDATTYQDTSVKFHMSTTTEFDTGAPTSSISAKNWNDDELYPGQDGIVIPGYNSLIDILVDGSGPTSRKIDYKLQHAVTKVTAGYKTSGGSTCPYYIDFSNKPSVCVDYVVIAVPLGVLKKGSIQFVPSLPKDKTDAIGRIGFGLVNKVFLKFDTKFWGDYEFFGIASSGTQGPFNYWVNLDAAISGSKVLMGVALGSVADFTETRTDTEVVAEAIKRIRVMYPNAPNPTDYRITRWKSDPYIGGSYSFGAIGIKGNYDKYPDWDVVAENVGGIFFAGEHTDADYRGTIHGAMNAGRQAAADIVDYHTDDGFRFSPNAALTIALVLASFFVSFAF